MAKPRKSWEPVYRFGASGDRYFAPPVLGETKGSALYVRSKSKKRKK